MNRGTRPSNEAIMSDQSTSCRLSRRGAMASIGAAGMALVHSTSSSLAQGADMEAQTSPARYLTAQFMQAQATQKEGEWLETLGFHTPGDGGDALYQLQKLGDRKANGADLIALKNGLVAVLHESEAINYRMFGAVSDGKSDDGVQIKLAHAYANEHQVPVVNPSGEYWVKKTNGIIIKTNVHWGKSIIHIDERHNSRRMPRFIVQNDEPTVDLTKNEKIKKALIAKLRPGVQQIDELALYTNHMLVVQDANDRIGIRAGYKGNKGWAREELFYVEEEGRVVGSVAWTFKDFTSIRAVPCNRHFIVIEGGGFYLSGHSPEGSKPGYHQNGFSVQRSRTVIREQWMGLEPGNRDVSSEPRSGFYSFSNCYDSTLENIRLMPWEQGRRPPAARVKHGTYGIGGARMLNCTFRNLTAEGGWVSWGVFGTNLNKNFRLEYCRLNRVDVHFHCWNLHISNCNIGYKGISMTGGGDLLVENTTRDGNSFIHFRPDYGSKWDGPIRIRNCTLRPVSAGRTSILQMHTQNFDYKYPVGYGTSIAIEDFRIDYANAPDSAAECLVMDIPGFSEGKGGRLFFPQHILFRNILVKNRELGVRLLRLPDPYRYNVRHEGGCDEDRLRPNCTLICDNVQLERTVPGHPSDPAGAHLLLGGKEDGTYADALALFPKILFRDCENIALRFVNCAASVSFERCSVNMASLAGLRGEARFMDCHLQPEVKEAKGDLYALDSTIGTHFTNCTLHAPVVDGKVRPELIDQVGFLKVNESLRHYHLNTTLGNSVVRHFREKGTPFTPAFVAMLRSRHELEG